MASATRSAGGARGGVQLVRLAVEERADVAILDRAAEEIAALDHQLGAEDGPVARREHRADGAGEAHLVGGERARRRHPQRVAGPEPPHRQRARVRGRLDGQAAIRRRRRLGLASRGWRARRTGSAPTGAGCRTGHRRRALAAAWASVGWAPGVETPGSAPVLCLAARVSVPPARIRRALRQLLPLLPTMWHTSWLEFS